ncbi:MAG: hypothetical protein Q8R30_04710 [bacterium]|nr:hypothetical protein [bacterium]
MNKKRPHKGSDLAGNAWMFATIDAARTVYQTILKKPGFMVGKADCSLDTGFFNRQPVLIFLWGDTVDPEHVKSIETLAVHAGGTELAPELKAELLRQVRLRWRALRAKRPRGGMIQRHHPHGKLWSDLRD